MGLRAALGVAVLLSVVPVAAHAQPRPVTYDVTFTYDEYPGQVDGLVCDGASAPQDGAPETCRGFYKGEAFFTGDVKGIQRYVLEAWMDLDGRLRYRGVVTFEAEVRRCGSGTFQAFEDGYVELAKTDPLTGRAPGFNTWQILPGTMTGGLKGRLLGGEGVNHWSAAPAETDRDFGYGTFTGELTCRR